MAATFPAEVVANRGYASNQKPGGRPVQYRPPARLLGGRCRPRHQTSPARKIR